MYKFKVVGCVIVIYVFLDYFVMYLNSLFLVLFFLLFLNKLNCDEESGIRSGLFGYIMK